MISDEASQTESEEIINYDSFVASSETYIIDLPVINTMINGPFRLAHSVFANQSNF